MDTYYFLDTQTLWMIKHLTLAAILGMAIGFEREHRGKPAGLRTYTLVGLGAALFTMLSVSGVFGTLSDPTRIAANVVVGIGFIGGGLIFLKGEKLEGLTTAAGLWTTAAIGMAVGFGLTAVAVYTTILVLLILWAMRAVEDRIHQGLEKNSDS